MSVISGEFLPLLTDNNEFIDECCLIYTLKSSIAYLLLKRVRFVLVIRYEQNKTTKKHCLQVVVVLVFDTNEKMFNTWTHLFFLSFFMVRMQDLCSNITFTMTLTSPFDLVLPKLLWFRIKIVTII